MSKITKRTVDQAKPKEKDYFLWDDTMPGFGLRVYPSGKKSYCVQYRGRDNKQNRIALGLHGKITPELARKLAQKAFGQIAEGKNPAKAKQERNKDITVAQLCDLYLEEGCTHKKPSTLSTDRGRIERHIKPLLGKKSVRSIERADVEKFLREVGAGKTAKDIKTKKHGRAIVKGGKGTATRTVGLLGGIFTFAVSRGLRADNPATGVKKYPEKKRERVLSTEELAKLGRALELEEKSGTNLYALQAIRLILLTGCRKGEALSLKWNYIDWERGLLLLPDSKTGKKVIPVSDLALEVLKNVKRISGNPYVFPGKGKDHYKSLQKVWEKIRKACGLKNVRLHDFRHLFATTGVTMGTGDRLLIMGALLGHKDRSTTTRYSHLVQNPLREEAEKVGQEIQRKLHGEN